MNIDELVAKEKEILKELNEGNTESFAELRKIAVTLCNMYELCKCGFISKHKEIGICKGCDGR